MSKRGWMVLATAALGFALTLAVGGCFKTPTSPTLFSSLQGGGHQPGGGGAFATPTPTGGGGGVFPTPTPGSGGGGSGSISGNVTGSGGATVDITAVAMGGAMTTVHRTGDGPYTISGLADGLYGVVADTTSGTPLSASYPGGVTVSGGAAVTGIDLALL
jgi:hypothetical protein